MVDVKTWKNALMCLPLACVLIIAMVAIETRCPYSRYCNNIIRVDNPVLLKEEQIVGKNGPISGCNLFSGKWVHDNVSYPLYKERQCSLIGDQFTACEKYGRKDTNYQNWRWQPHHCDIPRSFFNNKNFIKSVDYSIHSLHNFI